MEESYIDKDRAAAVTGSDDLKGCIMKHRGRMADRIPLEFDINILIEQAEHEMKRGDPYVIIMD